MKTITAEPESLGIYSLFHIGKHIIQGHALLAPMAGVTDLPFRQICRDLGAALTTSEMITSDTSLWASTKSSSRLRMDDNTYIPRSMQIAGTDPEQLALAAIQCVELGADIIDINMGCPAKKVCKKLAGSALLKDEALVAKILETVVESVDVPVTLKTRTGWDKQNKNGINVAIMAEELGIAAIAIHGRTRECRFHGLAEYETITRITDAVNIPVIANGDISSAQKAHDVLNETGAAAVMIGRSALGNPWIFAQINALLTDKNDKIAPPEPSTIQPVALEHIKALHDFYGEFKGLRIARKHFAWYSKNLPLSKESIKTFNQIEAAEQQLQHITNYFTHLTNYEEQAA